VVAEKPHEPSDRVPAVVHVATVGSACHAGGRGFVTGPFTVDSLSPHRTLEPTAEEEVAESTEEFAPTILANLRKAGVQNTVRQEHLSFDWLEPSAGTWVHARGAFTDADGAERSVAVSVGPEYGTVDADQVREAAKEASRGAGADLLLVCAFAFDATAGETAKDFAPSDSSGWAVAAEERKLGRLRVLLVRMNPDLAMGAELLKKTGAGNLFMVFGEPDVDIRRTEDDQVVVEIRGVDVYDPTTGQVRSDSTDDIACWLVDTNYNEESFFVREAYFTGAGDPYQSLRRALRADIDEAACMVRASWGRPSPLRLPAWEPGRSRWSLGDSRHRRRPTSWRYEGSSGVPRARPSSRPVAGRSHRLLTPVRPSGPGTDEPRPRGHRERHRTTGSRQLRARWQRTRCSPARTRVVVRRLVVVPQGTPLRRLLGGRPRVTLSRTAALRDTCRDAPSAGFGR
jgi:hypothetical protein